MNFLLKNANSVNFLGISMTNFLFQNANLGLFRIIK